MVMKFHPSSKAEGKTEKLRPPLKIEKDLLYQDNFLELGGRLGRNSRIGVRSDKSSILFIRSELF